MKRRDFTNVIALLTLPRIGNAQSADRPATTGKAGILSPRAQRRRALKLSVERPTIHKFMNRKTATMLGLAMPQGPLLRADAVIR